MSKIPEDILRAAKRAYMTYPKAGEDEWMPMARALLAERNKYQWQSIDTAPKDGTIIDLCTTSGVVCLNEWWIEDDGEAFWSCDFDDKFLSHWRPAMPLPSPL